MKDLNFATDRKKGGVDKRDTIELPINGEIYFAYRPTTNSIAIFYSSVGKKNVAIQLSGIEQFLERCLEPEAFALIMKAVENDTLEYGALVELAQEIIEEFAENPTTPSAASSGSRASTGASSTANSRRPASTRASSRSRVSAE